MWTVYGLKNCDTCRSALKWLSERGRDATLHDVRRDGIPPDRLTAWMKTVGWEVLLNKRGTTWRGISDVEKENMDEKTARELILTYPALMKRPVFDRGDIVLVGFKEPQKTAILDA